MFIIQEQSSMHDLDESPTASKVSIAVTNGASDESEVHVYTH